MRKYNKISIECLEHDKNPSLFSGNKIDIKLSKTIIAINTDLSDIIDGRHRGTNMPDVTDGSYRNTDLSDIIDGRHRGTDMPDVTDGRYRSKDLPDVTDGIHSDTRHIRASVTSISDIRQIRA
jgi:hypothetical protein